MEKFICVHTMGFDSSRAEYFREKVQKWLGNSCSVIVNDDALIVLPKGTETIGRVNNGDIFSLVQREDRGHDIVVYNFPRNKEAKYGDTYIQINGKIIKITPYCWAKVEDTENIRFTLTLPNGRKEDCVDIQSIMAILSSVVEDEVIDSVCR